MLRALRVLEEQRRPARLDDPVDDLRDLEVGVDLGRDAPQLALALEERDPLAEVFRGGRGQGADQSMERAALRLAAALLLAHECPRPKKGLACVRRHLHHLTRDRGEHVRSAGIMSASDSSAWLRTRRSASASRRAAPPHPGAEDRLESVLQAGIGPSNAAPFRCRSTTTAAAAERSRSRSRACPPPIRAAAHRLALPQPRRPGRLGRRLPRSARGRSSSATRSARRFDLVGFDPRGIIRSTAFRCFGNPKQWEPYFTPFAFPMTPAEEAVWITADRYLDAACAQRGGKIGEPHVHRQRRP